MICDYLEALVCSEHGGRGPGGLERRLQGAASGPDQLEGLGELDLGVQEL